MSRKSETPITDLIDRLLSRDCPPDAIRAAVFELEKASAVNARSMAADLQLLNRLRAKDAARKKVSRARVRGTSADNQKTDILAYSESKNIDSVKIESRKSSGGRPGVKRPSSHGLELPGDWRPSEGHYGEAHRAGLARADVDRIAEKMRLWAIANRHRSQGRKADLDGWNATFTGTWLAKEIEERKKGAGRSSAAKTLGQMAFGGIHGR